MNTPVHTGSGFSMSPTPMLSGPARCRRRAGLDPKRTLSSGEQRMKRIYLTRASLFAQPAHGPAPGLCPTCNVLLASALPCPNRCPGSRLKMAAPWPRPWEPLSCLTSVSPDFSRPPMIPGRVPGRVHRRRAPPSASGGAPGLIGCYTARPMGAR